SAITVNPQFPQVIAYSGKVLSNNGVSYQLYCLRTVLPMAAMLISSTGGTISAEFQSQELATTLSLILNHRDASDEYTGTDTSGDRFDLNVSKNVTQHFRSASLTVRLTNGTPLDLTMMCL